MFSIQETYRKNIYSVMGTLVFHILLVGAFMLAEMRLEVNYKAEEAILIDFTSTIEEILPEEKIVDEQTTSSQSEKQINNTSNRAVNDAASVKSQNDRFFDENYQKEIEYAKKMVIDVNKQLSKKNSPISKIEMPEITTEGQNPDSISNLIYTGKSNIHYFLENRYHVRLPVPVYLARSGGEIVIEIQVDRSGKVIKTNLRSNRNNTDELITEYALQAASRTVFNRDPKAPATQSGTITYKFVSQ